MGFYEHTGNVEDIFLSLNNDGGNSEETDEDKRFRCGGGCWDNLMDCSTPTDEGLQIDQEQCMDSYISCIGRCEREFGLRSQVNADAYVVSTLGMTVKR